MPRGVTRTKLRIVFIRVTPQGITRTKLRIVFSRVTPWGVTRTNSRPRVKDRNKNFFDKYLYICMQKGKEIEFSQTESLKHERQSFHFSLIQNYGLDRQRGNVG